LLAEAAAFGQLLLRQAARRAPFDRLRMHERAKLRPTSWRISMHKQIASRGVRVEIEQASGVRAS